MAPLLSWQQARKPCNTLSVVCHVWSAQSCGGIIRAGDRVSAVHYDENIHQEVSKYECYFSRLLQQLSSVCKRCVYCMDFDP